MTESGVKVLSISKEIEVLKNIKRVCKQKLTLFKKFIDKCLDPNIAQSIRQLRKLANSRNGMQALFDLPHLNKESFQGLRNLLDLVLKHKRALTVLGQPTEKWDAPLIHLINLKLDKETRKEWENRILGVKCLPLSKCQIF